MDRRTLRSASCNGSGKNPPPSSPAAVPPSASVAGAGSKDDADAGERKALLPRQPPGGMARKARKPSNRRVQWKDRHGKKLTEVLEFQPRYVPKRHPCLHFFPRILRLCVGAIILDDDVSDSKNPMVSWQTVKSDDFCVSCLFGRLR